MLFCQVAWLYTLVSIGVAVRAFKLTASEDVVTVNVRQNVTLRWTYEIAAGESYDILWGTSHHRGSSIRDILFRKSSSEAVARPSSTMPAKYFGRVNIVSQASLFIRHVDLSDEGFYVCQIKGQFVTLRKKINLTVIDPPRIVPQLVQRERWIEGSSQELTCNSVGKPKPKLTWKKDGNILAQGRRTAKLEFSPVTYKDEGVYTCIAENVGGREEEQVQISVLYAPKDTIITTDAPEDTVTDGSLITITCKARGNPVPKYNFSIGGNRIADRKAERSGILTVTAIRNSPSGIYSCQPENDVGRGPVSEVTVYVRYAPTITLRPSNKIVDENTPVTVQCEAKGFPPPTIKWVKLLGNRNVGNGDSLLLRNVHRSDKGRYRCIAFNSIGRDTAEFNINVYYTPVINKTASSQDVPTWAGTTTNLTCVADGNPAPRYIWTNSSGVVATSENSGILQVTPQGPNGFGPYTCTVTNTKGRDQLDIRLVKVEPSPPQNVEVNAINSTAILVKWKAPLYPNGLLKLYTVLYERTPYFKTGDPILETVKANVTEKTIGGLSPFTNYTVQVMVVNDLTGTESKPVTVVTMSAVPPDSELQKDEKSSLPHGISTEGILVIVFGAIVAAIIAAVALYCVAKGKLCSLYTRANSTSELDLQTNQNGTCGNTDNVQNPGVLKRPAEVDYEVKYDVFICYSSKDITWVKELLAELENRHFTCCIDFKNFIPGVAIVENIYQAIYHSRKTVAILSPDFVNSEWCNHELQKALTRIRSHQVIPIVYRDCEIPLILRDRTYLDWENCHVKPYFWEQLERSLKLPNDGDTCLDRGAAFEVESAV